MEKKMRSMKKKPVVIDLSEDLIPQKPSKFDVGDYDYELRQGDKLQGFDEDLNFLLTNSNTGLEPEESTKTPAKNKKNKAKSTQNPASPKIPIQPMENLVESAHNGKFLALGDQFLNLRVSPETQPAESLENSGIELPESGKTILKKGKKAIAGNRVIHWEITRDLDVIDFLSDEETPTLDSTIYSKDLDDSAAVSVLPQPKQSRGKENRDRIGRVESHVASDSSEAVPGMPQSETVPESDLKHAKSGLKVGNITPINGLGPVQDTSTIDAEKEIPGKEEPAKKPDSDFRTTTPVSTADSLTSKRSKFGRLSSAKATQIQQLPNVQPVSTIFGLSHDQIFKTELTDVKMKLIMNVPMSKMCKNALSVVMAENEGLFADELKRNQFVGLCTNVALYEAAGFNQVTKRMPDLMLWLSTCKPLTLQHTRTNVTLSNKQKHKNSLDYTVFSFFGHILLWANELQHEAGLPTIIDKFTLGISRQDILKSLGGHHLWDRLRRDKTINTNRWKHIQKFRLLFAFEEHQFVLILRCMNLGMRVC